MFNSQFLIKESSVGEIVDRTFNVVHHEGKKLDTYKGKIKAVNSVNIILEDPEEADDLYTFWDKASVDWYLDTFVRPNKAPEFENPEIVFPYTYAWRSRFYDNGWGHAQLLATLLQRLNYGELPFYRVEDVQQLIRETYKHIHPDLVLAVLAWLKRENMMIFMINIELVKELVKAQRIDVLEILLKQVTNQPTTQKAITPSFLYGTIDVYGLLEHTPAYQDYQIIVNFDKKGNPIGIESFHHHRELNANGSIQLDLLHDLDWGLMLAKKLGVKLQKVTIHANHLFAYLDTPSQNDTKTTIQQQLLEATNAYAPDKISSEDIEKVINSKKFIKKIRQTIKLFNQA